MDPWQGAVITWEKPMDVPVAPVEINPESYQLPLTGGEEPPAQSFLQPGATPQPAALPRVAPPAVTPFKAPPEEHLLAKPPPPAEVEAITSVLSQQTQAPTALAAAEAGHCRVRWIAA